MYIILVVFMSRFVSVMYDIKGKAYKLFVITYNIH